MVVDASGDLFGTQASGGANNDGAVFEIVNTGSGYASPPTTLASFDGAAGSGPSGGLIADAAGDLFGVATQGGASGDGTIFELTRTADGYATTPTLLASFDGTDGNGPTTQLTMDSAGDLFGITERGPSTSTIFELAKTANGYASAPTTLAQFNAPFETGPLTIDANGDLYSISLSSAGPSTGAVFEIAKTASGYASTPTTLATLSAADGTPSGALVADAAGNLFGLTNGGGANGAGEIFEIAKVNDSYAATAIVLASFPQENDHGGALIIDGADNLFIQQQPSGGPSGGEFYELPKTGGIYASTVTALAQEPFSPSSGLTGGPSGTFFGTTQGGGQLGFFTNSTAYEVTGTGYVPATASTGETLGANDTPGQVLVGTPNDDTFFARHSSVSMTGDGGADTFVFQFEPWTAGQITDFTPGNDKLDISALLTGIGYTGHDPVADGVVTFQSDGSGDTQVLFHDPANAWPTLVTTLDGVSPTGLTSANTLGEGGSSSGGGSATISVISTFDTTGPNASFLPIGQLVLDASGNLLGTAQSGGANNDGTIFEIARSGSGFAGTPTTLVSFDGTDGQLPLAGLIADTAGNLFGTAASGGASGDGTIFELAKTADGYAAAPTVLASFDGTDGVGPSNQLVTDAAGDLFGITASGGFNATIFELAKTSGGYASAPTMLAQFNAPGSAAPLVIDANGDLFATSLSKAGPSTGTVFEIANTAGGYAMTPTTLATLGAADGTPSGALVADAAGNLFGLTNGGGANGSGEIFEIANTNDGYASVATVLASFPQENNHAGALLIDGAGDLFAETLPSGGAFGGELFELAKTDSGYTSALTAVTSLDGGGQTPMPGMMADSSGDIFGTANGGGPLQESPPVGTVWEITNSGFVPTSSGGSGGGTTGETLTANDTPGQVLIGTPNDDTFFAGHSSVSMTGNGGADTFVFQFEPWTAGQITDFTPGNDKLDISALLTSIGYTGHDPVADGVVTFQSDGSGDTQVLFHDPANAWPTLVTTLDGVLPTGLTSANTFGTAGSSSGGGGTTGETLTANDTAGQLLVGTPNNDTFFAGHNSVVMTGDGGADQFVFQFLPWNAGSITDFNTAADVLNLKGIFAAIGYTGSNPVADGFLVFHSDGQGDTQVIVNPQGPSTQIPIAVTTLDHVDPSMIHSSDYLFA
jgi:uncharacterized repeat protein (TIGR03803 family)